MYNTNTKNNKKSNVNKPWSPRPEKSVKKTSKKSGQAKFVDQMKQTRKALYYTRTPVPANSNITLSENGAIMYKSSGSALVDINFKISAMREMEEGQIVALFHKAYSENPRLAMRWLGYLRDAREGQGERRSFRVIIKDMATNGGDKIVNKLIPLFGEYGRYDDLFVLFGTPCEKTMIDFVSKQIKKDYSKLKELKKNV